MLKICSIFVIDVLDEIRISGVNLNKIKNYEDKYVNHAIHV